MHFSPSVSSGSNILEVHLLGVMCAQDSQSLYRPDSMCYTGRFASVHDRLQHMTSVMEEHFLSPLGTLLLSPFQLGDPECVM